VTVRKYNCTFCWKWRSDEYIHNKIISRLVKGTIGFHSNIILDIKPSILKS
jgi:hypothetical protein